MKKTYLATAVATLFVSSITTAIAADTLLDDVVVSVNRAEQKSFDAPAAIQAINKDVIQDVGPQVNISESLNRVPGVVALNRQNYGQDLQISIRGFGARTQFGVRGVRLITDGIPATIPDGQGQSSTISLTSAERIEVLRGPLAQLYGNAAGGVIQVFTKDASANPELLLQGYLGSYGLKRSDIQYSEKLGKFGIVVDYSTFRTDGFRNNSQAERNQFNGKFVYQHDDQTKLSLIANVFDQPYAYDAAGLTTVAEGLATPTKSLNPASYRDRKSVDQRQFGLVLTHNVDSVTQINFRIYDGSRKVLAYTGSNLLPVGQTAADPKWQAIDRDFSGIGFDYGTKTKLSDKDVFWKIGGNLDISKEINQQGVASNGEKSTTNTTLNFNKDQSAKNKDVFAQGNIFLGDRFSLLGGARVTNVEMHVFNLKSNTDLGVVNYQSVNPVIGGTYYLLNNMNLFLNYGRGFETPTLTELGYTNVSGTPTSGFNKSLLASKSKHYEAGMKWLPSPTSRVDLSIFNIKTSDEIVVDANSTTTSSYRNVPGGTTRKGWELSATELLLNSLRGTLAISQIDASFNDGFTTGTNGTTTTVSAGNRIAGIPKGQLFTELTWSDRDFYRNKYRQVMGTTLGVEVVAAGSIFANDSNAADKKSPGYAVYNLKVSHRWDLSPFTLTAYGRLDNLADKRYIGSVIVGNANPFEPAPGRNWVVGLNAITRF